MTSIVEIVYTDEEPLDTDQFIDLLKRSGLAERRPVGDRPTMASMVLNADILMTAWAGDTPIGVARSVTDFSYCCYLSDLAVDEAWQRQGVGEQLINATVARLSPQCQLILLSAPAATEFYPRVGFDPHKSAWVRKPST
ncbi:MAG: GNAT family N-acetyltransferase [Pseudomonadota bacterium]